ncbi:MAG TPA: TetR/AcrR family transcriptional regulator [Amycolatopsis sp.]|nr:TetR/AcrR family transcriptional regulator [Amycolatopsis sp.]
MPYRRTPKVQQRLDALRDAIVAAAVEQLAEQGYAGCSVAAVAERAGVAVGTVYRHFPTKAELVVRVFRQVVTREVEAVRTASAGPGDPVERVAAVFETFAARALKAPRLAYALLAEPVDASIEAERLEFRRAFRDVVAGHVAEGVRAGALPAQDAVLTAAALVGAAAEVLIGPLTSGDVSEVGELRTFVVRALGGSGVHDA